MNSTILLITDIHPPLPTLNINNDPQPKVTILILTLLIILAIIAYILWKKLKKRHKTQPLSPLEWALKELDKTPQANSLQKNDIHTRVLFYYFSKYAQIEAQGSTSEELLNLIQKTKKLPPTSHEQLKQMLKNCDNTRFSPSPQSYTLQTPDIRSFILAHPIPSQQSQSA